MLTGDGELQEGQIYEALQTTRQQQVENLLVIVDHNKLQTDKYVSEITDLGDLNRKFEAFGWNVVECDGHDHASIETAYAEAIAHPGRPTCVIAHTIKGKGVSFMEGDFAWHAQVPTADHLAAALAELDQELTK